MVCVYVNVSVYVNVCVRARVCVCYTRVRERKVYIVFTQANIIVAVGVSLICNVYTAVNTIS